MPNLSGLNPAGHLRSARVRPWSLTIFVIVSILSAAVNAYTPVWSDYNCGYSRYADAGSMPLSPSQQVIGGQEARYLEFPWQAWIRFNANGALLCSGVILNRRWIVTDAWCTIGYRPDEIIVIVGDHQRSDPYNYYRQYMNVESIIVHPLFSQTTFENDISLIQTSWDIYLDYYYYASPICAPDSSNSYADRFSQTSGWGTTQVGVSCCEDTLRYTTVNITSNAFCRAAIPGLTIFDSMVCTTDNRGNVVRGSCIGDAGGPLTVKEADGRFHLVGIVSWHINDCASGYPDGYTRISSYIDWITDYVTANMSSIGPTADETGSTAPVTVETTQASWQTTAVQTTAAATTTTTPPFITTTPPSAPKLYPAPYVKATMATAMNASDAITASCSSSIASDFRTSFQDVVNRINAAITKGQLCTTSGGAISVMPGQIQHNFMGTQVQTQFSLLVGTNPADTVTIGLDESCSWEASQYAQAFENWRQPIISNIFGCPAVDISPPGFSWQSSAWGCF